MSAATWVRPLGFAIVLAAVVLIAPGWTRAPVGKKVDKGWGMEITNSIGMKLVRIPAGKFKMGSPKKEQDEAIKDYERIAKEKASDTIRELFRSEGPQHEVEITKEFWLGVHEVTQKDFKEVMGYNPSYFSTDGTEKAGLKYLSKTAGGKDEVAGKDTSDFPVENVSWEEADEFCKKLTAKIRERGRTYRLPTEAEWEYSCRGEPPSYQTFHFGNSLSSTQANFDGIYPYGVADKGPYLERTCKVGSYEKNRFGLHDMHGNVWEWCADWYGKDYYGESKGAKDPAGPSEGSLRVLRGGSWRHVGQYCRSADRSRRTPASRDGDLGFRVALVPSAR